MIPSGFVLDDEPSDTGKIPEGFVLDDVGGPPAGFVMDEEPSAGVKAGIFNAEDTTTTKAAKVAGTFAYGPLDAWMTLVSMPAEWAASVVGEAGARVFGLPEQRQKEVAAEFGRRFHYEPQTAPVKAALQEASPIFEAIGDIGSFVADAVSNKSSDLGSHVTWEPTSETGKKIKNDVMVPTVRAIGNKIREFSEPLRNDPILNNARSPLPILLKAMVELGILKKGTDVIKATPEILTEGAQKIAGGLSAKNIEAQRGGIGREATVPLKTTPVPETGRGFVPPMIPKISTEPIAPEIVQAKREATEKAVSEMPIKEEQGIRSRRVCIR